MSLTDACESKRDRAPRKDRAPQTGDIRLAASDGRRERKEQKACAPDSTNPSRKARSSALRAPSIGASRPPTKDIAIGAIDTEEQSIVVAAPSKLIDMD
jgi:hypothetical protein